MPARQPDPPQPHPHRRAARTVLALAAAVVLVAATAGACSSHADHEPSAEEATPTSARGRFPSTTAPAPSSAGVDGVDDRAAARILADAFVAEGMAGDDARCVAGAIMARVDTSDLLAVGAQRAGGEGAAATGRLAAATEAALGECGIPLAGEEPGVSKPDPAPDPGGSGAG